MYSREVSFRYVIMRDDADYILAHPVESDPVITMADDAGIKTSFRGSFIYDERIDWMADRIRPEMTIDGVTYPLGIFLPATVELIEDATKRYFSIEAYDQCWIVRDTRSETRVSLAANTNYIAAIESLLVQCGVAVWSATPTEATLQEQREWDIGTSFLDIVNELLGEINYRELWFNYQGLAILEPIKLPTAENVTHELKDDDVKSLLLPEIKRTTDIYATANVFLCIVDNPDKDKIMVAKAENNNMGSPLSIPRRGRRITKVERLNNIASQEELQAYADQMVFDSIYAGETATVVTGLFPGYGVQEIVALQYGDFSSICIEHNWSMTLGLGGNMQHTLERVILVYDSE